MPLLPDLHHRLWYAYCCLPRDENGELPLITSVERDHGIPKGTLSRMLRGERLNVHWQTFTLVSQALRASEHWLRHGGTGGPKTRHVVPMPPPGVPQRRYGDVPGWAESEATARRDPSRQIPPEAFLAGADLEVTRYLERVGPADVVAISDFAWRTLAQDEQAAYSTAEAKRASPGRPRSSARRA